MTNVELSQALAAIRARWRGAPRVGIILGTGLGNLAQEVALETEISYRDIPHFPRSTAMAHRGCLLFGTIAGVSVVTMAGRCHLYEGYSLAEVQFPIHVMRQLGIELLIVSNAAGGLNPHFQTGDVMVIENHLNLMFFSPGSGGLPAVLSTEKSVPEPPAASGLLSSPGRLATPYDPALITQALAIARRGNFICQRGVYVGVPGPNYETRSEYRLFRRIGGDVVGMSTIPEVLAATALGIRVLGLSTVTNVATPDAPQIVTSDEVVHFAGVAEPKLRQIVLGILQSL